MKANRRRCGTGKGTTGHEMPRVPRCRVEAGEEQQDGGVLPGLWVDMYQRGQQNQGCWKAAQSGREGRPEMITIEQLLRRDGYWIGGIRPKDYLVIASHDWNGPFDIRCDGVDDQVQINKAIGEVRCVRLTGGNFIIGQPINLEASDSQASKPTGDGGAAGNK